MKQFAIPIAIIIAGALIAGAVIWAPGTGSNNSASNTTSELNYDPAKMEERISEIGVDNKILGDADAPIIITEYSDTECPFCKRYHDTMIQIIDKYGAEGQVGWEYKHFPIPQLHPEAPMQAHALECINELGGDEAFWIGTDAIFTVTPENAPLESSKLAAIANVAGVDTDEFNECMESGDHEETVEEEVQDARDHGASGTPYSVIRLSTPLDSATQQAIEEIDASVSDQDLFTIAEDGTQIRMSGAMPFNVVDQLITTILEADA